jgi:hypothetical protein
VGHATGIAHPPRYSALSSYVRLPPWRRLRRTQQRAPHDLEADTCHWQQTCSASERLVKGPPGSGGWHSGNYAGRVPMSCSWHSRRLADAARKVGGVTCGMSSFRPSDHDHLHVIVESWEAQLLRPDPRRRDVRVDSFHVRHTLRVPMAARRCSCLGRAEYGAGGIVSQGTAGELVPGDSQAKWLSGSRVGHGRRQVFATCRIPGWVV